MCTKCQKGGLGPDGKQQDEYELDKSDPLNPKCFKKFCFEGCICYSHESSCDTCDVGKGLIKLGINVGCHDCHDTNCANCPDDYLKCESCKVGFGYYKGSC